MESGGGEYTGQLESFEQLILQLCAFLRVNYVIIVCHCHHLFTADLLKLFKLHLIYPLSIIYLSILTNLYTFSWCKNFFGSFSKLISYAQIKTGRWKPNYCHSTLSNIATFVISFGIW